MRMAAPITGLLLSCAIAGALPSAGAQPPASQPAVETLQYAIMRKGAIVSSGLTADLRHDVVRQHLTV